MPHACPPTPCHSKAERGSRTHPRASGSTGKQWKGCLEGRRRRARPAGRATHRCCVTTWVSGEPPQSRCTGPLQPPGPESNHRHPFFVDFTYRTRFIEKRLQKRATAGGLMQKRRKGHDQPISAEYRCRIIKAARPLLAHRVRWTYLPGIGDNRAPLPWEGGCARRRGLAASIAAPKVHRS